MNIPIISAIAIALGATLALGTPGQADPYLKFELGGAFSETGDAFWRSPGFPADPKVFFDLDNGDGFFASAAIGHQWGNGFRGDVALSFFGETDFAGPWSRTDPVTPGPHADVRGSVKSMALMANGYWSPFAGKGGKLQPFLTAGIGMARNSMSDWTRTNAAATRPVRTFEGDTSTDFAWSVGFGLTAEIGSVGGNPVMLEGTYRYFDLGTAKGSGTPLPSNGSSMPVTPLQFENRDHVISVGVRIPLMKN